MQQGLEDKVERLTAVSNQSCLIALDKCLTYCRSKPSGYYQALGYMVSTRDRIQQAAAEVGKCI